MRTVLTLLPTSLIFTRGSDSLSTDQQAGGTSSRSQSFILSHCLKLTQNTLSSKTEGNETCDITSCERARIFSQTVENIRLAAVTKRFLTCSFELSCTYIKHSNESRWVCFLLQISVPSNESMSSRPLKDNNSCALHNHVKDYTTASGSSDDCDSVVI